MDLRYNRFLVNNITVSFFLLLVLFLPNSSELTRVYFAALLIAIPLFLGTRKNLCFDYLTIAGVGILMLHLVFTIIRFWFIVEPNLRDYTEFARLLLPVLMLLFRDRFKYVSVNALFVVFGIYVSVDFLISILDFLNFNFMGLVTLTKSLYVSNVHSAVGYRICGLSSGPGQHGILMMVLFIFFYCLTFQRKKFVLPIFFSILCALPLFLTQSRTSMLVFGVISVAVPVYYLLFGNRQAQKRTVPALSLIVGGSAFLLIRFREFFSRLFQLINGLNQVSSYQDRLVGYRQLFDKAFQHPAFLIIGYGKEFFKTGVYDNEYLMMFLIYGPFIAFVILFGVLFYLIKFSLNKKKMERMYGTMLFFLLLAGLAFAYPVSFFTQTAIIPVLVLFINLAYWENKTIKVKKRVEI